jgi:hypothetical protein
MVVIIYFLTKQHGDYWIYKFLTFSPKFKWGRESFYIGTNINDMVLDTLTETKKIKDKRKNIYKSI